MFAVELLYTIFTPEAGSEAPRRVPDSADTRSAVRQTVCLQSGGFKFPISSQIGK
jgi:hypothetical protein